jgi:hypothetical protein
VEKTYEFWEINQKNRLKRFRKIKAKVKRPKAKNKNKSLLSRKKRNKFLLFILYKSKKNSLNQFSRKSIMYIWLGLKEKNPKSHFSWGKNFAYLQIYFRFPHFKTKKCPHPQMTLENLANPIASLAFLPDLLRITK